MADLLHDFIHQRCNINGDFSFRHFCHEWKTHRMNYLFLVQHDKERLSHFMQECNEYLTNCIYHNFIRHRRSDSDYHRSSLCIYILYTLMTQQPCFENKSAPTFIALPEYAWCALADLATFAVDKHIADLQHILSHMIGNHYFVYCMERPIPYTVSQTEPYPMDDKIYCHGTRSRMPLGACESFASLNITEIRSSKERYRSALCACDSAFNDMETDSASDSFVRRLESITAAYESALQKCRHRNNHKLVVQYPTRVTHPTPVSEEALHAYQKSCSEYQAAIDVFSMDKAQRVANGIDACVSRPIHDRDRAHNHNHSRPGSVTEIAVGRDSACAREVIDLVSDDDMTTDCDEKHGDVANPQNTGDDDDEDEMRTEELKPESTSLSSCDVSIATDSSPDHCRKRSRRKQQQTCNRLQRSKKRKTDGNDAIEIIEIVDDSDDVQHIRTDDEDHDDHDDHDDDGTTEKEHESNVSHSHAHVWPHIVIDRQRATAVMEDLAQLRNSYSVKKDFWRKVSLASRQKMDGISKLDEI